MEGREMVNPQGRVGTKFVAKSETTLIVERLNDLIADNLAVMHIYQTAAEHLEDERNVEIVQEYAQQHRTYASELASLITDYSGDADMDEGSSLLKRAWITLKAAVEKGDGPILSTIAQDAEKVLKNYSRALGEDWPDDVQEMVRDHLTGARLAHEKLTALSAALENNDQ